mgnify:CR=1 FL=1
MGYRIIYDDEIYHSHKYVAKVNNGSKPKYFYTAEAYRAYINGKKNTAVPGLKTTEALVNSVRNSKTKTVTEDKSNNRPKSREKNVTNDGKGAKRRESAPTTAGPIDEREELFNEVKAYIKSRKKKKK